MPNLNYKWCLLKQCTNTSKKTPKKLFVSVPTTPKIRKLWLELVNRTDISAKSNVFICEDHFDMEKDVANYMQYKMGFCKKMYMTRGAVPSKFLRLEGQKRKLSDLSTSGTDFIKRERIENDTKCEKESQLTEEYLFETCIKTEDVKMEFEESWLNM